jgi:hypothetical protein
MLIFIFQAVADARGLEILGILKEQTLPEVMGAVQGLDQIPLKLV